MRHHVCLCPDWPTPWCRQEWCLNCMVDVVARINDCCRWRAVHIMTHGQLLGMTLLLKCYFSLILYCQNILSDTIKGLLSFWPSVKRPEVHCRLRQWVEINGQTSKMYRIAKNESQWIGGNKQRANEQYLNEKYGCDLFFYVFEVLILLFGGGAGINTTTNYSCWNLMKINKQKLHI